MNTTLQGLFEERGFNAGPAKAQERDQWRGAPRVKSTAADDVDTLGASALSIALIGPHAQSRNEVANALAGHQAATTKEYAHYPELDEVPHLLEQKHDVVIVDLDSNPEYALDLVESVCCHGAATVMVYSTRADSALMIRCMRAGAREYLTFPFAPGIMAEALVRASVRRPAAKPAKKVGAKLFVFFGAKGGSGVTTLASNFAVLLARESGQKTLLIDLDLPLGDAALTLGITAQYSTVDALQNAGRLDSNFLSKLLRSYSPGLSVLGAPGKFIKMETSKDAIDRLVSVARQEFDYVVVDSGSRLDLVSTTLFEEAAILYLITQVSVPELRNSNRLISEFFAREGSKVEVVLNRYAPTLLGVDEEQITKALTRPARWKIPDDRATAVRTQSTATPLALDDSPISRVIRQMARAAGGLPETAEKKKRIIGLF
jgi:pilus assembly protein CpaE